MRHSLLLTVLACAAAAAQSFPEPPPLLRIVRTPAPDATAASRHTGAGALAVFGLSPVTGPSEWWRVEFHGSFGAVERADRALRPKHVATGFTRETAPAVASPVGWLALYRPWLSYRPNEASRLFGKARYFQALVFRIDPEAEADFVDAVRARKASLDGMNLDRPEMAYQVVSGAPTITYVFLAPLASLASFDELLARVPEYARPATKLAAARNISHEHLLFRVEPLLSTVPEDVASTDAEFWRPAR